MNKSHTQIALVAFTILFMAFMRVINADLNLYNMVPIAALGLFSGSVLQNKRMAYLIPLLAMLLSDIGLALFTQTQGFYGYSQLINYAALALVTLIGTFMVKRNVLTIAGYTISGTMIFFLLSNFGTFLSGYYGYTTAGLIECYIMAIPFYKSELATTFFLNSLLGDLAFSFLAFGILYLSSLRTAKA
jgi:hypothetical protein